MRKTFVLWSVALLVASAQTAKADVIVDIIESGGDVVATLSGSLNLDATDGNPVSSTGFNGYLASGGNISFTNDGTAAYSIDETWTSFGSGGFGNWDSSSGDALSLYSDGAVGVSAGYVSGSELSGTASAFGETFDSLGFDEGSFVTTLSNGTISDTVTINVGSSTVPEPTSLGTFCLLGLAATIRRRV